ncbi:hypothetical protein CC80DRAFT_48975 [Byssothecium circinans]|uniref:Uncharacterized protein n=1 Tax=Byssothecium circinans TaxID=147558 RepID=A0A6A5TZB5_9PLEO|nr:hypothetical protein CC80DRAFT_48975 [Byssothecium circinans]
MAKDCTLCSKPRDVLVRCQLGETQQWHFVCPGACWKSVSGGVEDARGMEGQFPWYRYGGMWKDRSADDRVSTKKSKKIKERQRGERRKNGKQD